MKTFVKVFPDFINDKLYLKRKFTDEEKLIIENIFNEILKKVQGSSRCTMYTDRHTVQVLNELKVL